MIHIITVHFKTEKWIDLQLKYINKHIKNYKMWVYCYGFDHTPHKDKFHFCKQYTSKCNNGSLDHMEKLNSLTNVVLNDKKTKDTDILVWLDSDSLPIRDLNYYINEKLLKYPLMAVNRPENGGDVIPHPSFACTSVSFWKKHKLNWDGVLGDNKQGLDGGLDDTGGKIYKILLEKNIEWHKLLRTNSLTKHKVFFTIYDDAIYHHGAGSRRNQNGYAPCRGGDFNLSYDESEIFNSLNDLLLNYNIK